MYELTGNTRHRTGLFGKMILQVSYRTVSVDGPGIRVKWRDATRDDLMAITEHKLAARAEEKGEPPPPPPDWDSRPRVEVRMSVHDRLTEISEYNCSDHDKIRMMLRSAKEYGD